MIVNETNQEIRLKIYYALEELVYQIRQFQPEDLEVMYTRSDEIKLLVDELVKRHDEL